MSDKSFKRELEEIILRIELNKKCIVLMHPEDIAKLDLDNLDNSFYFVEARILEHRKAIMLTNEKLKRAAWDAIKNNKVKYHRGRKSEDENH